MTSDTPENVHVSPTRIILAGLTIVTLTVGGAVGYQIWSSTQVEPSTDGWFAGYTDVTATPTSPFESPASRSGDEAILSFVVASPDEGCTPSWGGYYSLDKAGVDLELDRRIALLRERGGDVAISFGGQRSDELATVCTDPSKLETAYQSVVDRYTISTIDLDLEGKGLTNTAASQRRATAIAAVQKKRSATDPLAVWVTLPVSTSGLSEEGTAAVSSLLEAGVDLAGVNAMTMNFGETLGEDQSMAQASEKALEAVHRQLGALYEQADIHLSDATVWTKLGATPMIGQNDTAGEVFTLADAAELHAFALSKGLGRISMWSYNRDQPCGENYVNVRVVSGSCSGVDQESSGFANTLAAELSGSLFDSSTTVTVSQTVDPAELKDDPASSPYRIWSGSTTYLQGEKVVWHHNVYQAKWWSSGDMPDSPVEHEWDTPWKIVGPVLPGETLLPPPVLTPGLFPEWDGTAVYEKGEVVNFEDVPYWSKWWTKGDSPAAQSSNPDSSPWVPLTLDDVDNLTGKSAG